MVEPDFTDAELSFGVEMAMRAGKAFSLGTGDEETPERSVRVGKQMQTIGGKPVLIEAVEFSQIEPLLARLAAVATPKTDRLAINTTPDQRAEGTGAAVARAVWDGANRRRNPVGQQSLERAGRGD